MGTDKALVRVDGVPMARRVADTLVAAGCRPVAAVGGDAAAMASLGLERVADPRPGEGPIAGVIAALEAWPNASSVVVAACDLPRLGQASVRALLDALDRSPAADVAVGTTDRLQPLCAVWRPAVLPRLLAEFDRGERRLHAVLDGLATVEVDLDPTELLNVNAPGDLPSSLCNHVDP